jgi:hypothetical protein
VSGVRQGRFPTPLFVTLAVVTIIAVEAVDAVEELEKVTP